MPLIKLQLMFEFLSKDDKLYCLNVCGILGFNLIKLLIVLKGKDSDIKICLRAGSNHGP